MSSSVKSQAIILKYWDYSEKDLIVSFLTPTHGRLQGIAKGAKASRKRFGGVLDLFTQANLIFKEKKSSHLVFIEEGEVLDGFLNIRADYNAILLAQGLIEAAHHFFKEEEKNSQAYPILSKALKHIDREGVQKEIFWSVMLEYLEALGIDPHFEECVRCGPESQAMLLGFDIWRAGMVCQQCSTHSNPFIEISASLLNWIRFQKNLDSNEVPLLEKDEKVLDRLLRQHTKIQLDIDLEWGRFLHFI